MKQLILIVGRTGSGKSTIAKAISEKRGWKQVRSYTTRPMRKGEKNGSDHIFIKPQEVAKYKNKMAAYTKIGEYEYFTTWKVLNKCDLYVIDPKGVHELQENMKKAKKEEAFQLITVYVEIPKRIQQERLNKRGDQPDVVKKRIAAEDRQFSDFETELSQMENAIRITNAGTLAETVDEILEAIDRKKYADYEFVQKYERTPYIAVYKNGEYLFKAKTATSAKKVLDIS